MFLVSINLFIYFIYLFIPFGPRPGTTQYCKSNKLKGGQKQQNSKNNKENKGKTQKKKKKKKKKKKPSLAFGEQGKVRLLEKVFMAEIPGLQDNSGGETLTSLKAVFLHIFCIKFKSPTIMPIITECFTCLFIQKRTFLEKISP